jgi:hypothetical protein
MRVSQIKGQVPEPPRPLGVAGQAMWERLWSVPAPWIDRAVDVEAVGLLCESMDERAALRALIMSAPTAMRPVTDPKDRAALRALDTQIIAMMAVLGLSPASRKALTVSGGAANGSGDRLSQLRARSK